MEDSEFYIAVEALIDSPVTRLKSRRLEAISINNSSAIYNCYQCSIKHSSSTLPLWEQLQIYSTKVHPDLHMGTD